MDLENIRRNQQKTILAFALPSIIAMVLTSMITVVDGYFIGNYVGKEGIAAVNLGLPIIYLYLAVGLMVSVGGVALGGMAFGGKDISKCKSVFSQTMCTVLALTLILSIVMVFCLDPLLTFLQTDMQVAIHFKDYYSILLIQLPLMVINSSFGMFVRGEGNPQYFMKVNMMMVALNIILDFIFIHFLGWGVKGIAGASLIATVVALFWMLYFFFRKSKVYKLSAFRFSSSVLKRTLLNGSSEFIGEMSLSITMFAYNYMILRYVGNDGLSAFAIAGYIAYLFNMVIIGFGQGASPLISFSYGAHDRLLAANLRRITNQMVFATGVVVFVIVLVGSPWYGGLFTDDESIQQMTKTGVVLFASSFLFSGINVITSFYFTSIGRALESAIISLARGLVILLICIFTLPPFFGMTGIWIAALITEATTFLVSLLFIAKDRRQLENMDHLAAEGL